MSSEEKLDPQQIIFGLNREDDEQSLAGFLQLFSQARLTSVLIPRMSNEEIDQLVEMLSIIMRRHLNEKEYHTLFLGKEK